MFENSFYQLCLSKIVTFTKCFIWRLFPY